MATGAGKTKVISLLIAWSFFHKLYEPDSTLSRNFLVITPNIIVLDRLRADDAQVMAEWEHGGGFSVDAQVRIEAADRAGLERLLRYCARSAFALERLREIDPEHLVYESIKPGPGGNVSLMLTPMQLLDRLAALIPPPRKHRHRYYGALAPNSKLTGSGHRAGAAGR